MKKALLIIIPIFLLLGCAAHQVQQAQKPKIINKRIIYRDLTKPVVVHKKIPPQQNSIFNKTVLDESSIKIKKEPDEAALSKPGQTPNKEVDAIRPKDFIDFQNESSTLYDRDKLDRFMAATKSDSHIFVIGHSHGKSAVGTLKLASKRAQRIAEKLAASGYENVHAMASWGYTPVGFAPSKGVLIYVVQKDSKDVPIVFAKHVEKKENDISKDTMQFASPGPVISTDDV